MMRILNTLPVRAKVLEYKTFALTGRIAINTNTQGDALGYGGNWAFSPHNFIIYAFNGRTNF